MTGRSAPRMLGALLLVVCAGTVFVVVWGLTGWPTPSERVTAMVERSGLIAITGVIAALGAVLSAVVAFGGQRDSSERQQVIADADRWWENLRWAMEKSASKDALVRNTGVTALGHLAEIYPADSREAELIYGYLDAYLGTGSPSPMKVHTSTVSATFPDTDLDATLDEPESRYADVADEEEER